MEAVSGAGALFSESWMNILGLSDPPAAEKPRAAPAARPLTKANGDLIDLSDLATALPSSMRGGDIGCGMHSDTKSVFVSGNFEGDTTRLDVVLQKSSEIAHKALGHNNHLFYVFLGNVVPDVHAGTQDTLVRLLRMKREGLSLGADKVLPRDDVLLLSGARELGWLRLANRHSDSMEVVSPSSENAVSVLRRTSPLGGAGLQSNPAFAGWQMHDSSVQANLSGLADDPGEDEVRVLMFIKLASMATLTMRAPGLVRVFLNRLREENADGVDMVSVQRLMNFVSNHDGTMETALGELFGEDGKVSVVGVTVAPACEAVVEAIISYAQSSVLDYMKNSTLVSTVHNGHTIKEGGALWLLPSGTDEGEVVSKLPWGVNSETLQIEYRAVLGDKLEWKNEYNRQFAQFLVAFETGEMDSAMLDLFKAYLAMSVSGGTTSSKSALPLLGLRSVPSASVRGVVANESSAFATITRRTLVDPERLTSTQSDVVGVLDVFANVNTDAFTPSTYFAVCSFCGQTQWDLMKMAHTPVPDLSEGLCKHLYNVSMTLAAMLSTAVDGTALQDVGIEDLNGKIGPVVPAMPSKQGTRQPLRVMFFSHNEVDTAFVMFVPEAFVRYALSYYLVDYQAYETVRNAMVAVSGFMALPNDAAVPVKFEGLDSEEQQDLDTNLSGRLWALKRKRSNGKLEPFSADDYAATSAMLTAPATYTESSGHTLVRTTQTDRDPLCGLNIGIRPLPGISRVTIDTDCAPFHELFRVVASKRGRAN